MCKGALKVSPRRRVPATLPFIALWSAKVQSRKQMRFHSFVRTRKNVINPSEVHAAPTCGRFSLASSYPAKFQDDTRRSSYPGVGDRFRRFTPDHRKNRARVSLSCNRNYLRERRRPESIAIVTLVYGHRCFDGLLLIGDLISKSNAVKKDAPGISFQMERSFSLEKFGGSH